jgi:hypothetical protein
MKTSFFSGPVFSDAYTRQNLSQRTLICIRDLDQWAHQTQSRLDEGKQHVATAYRQSASMEKRIRALYGSTDKEQIKEYFSTKPKKKELRKLTDEAGNKPASDRAPLASALVHRETTTKLGETLDQIKHRWAQAWRMKNRIFSETNNGLPPLRKADGTPIEIRELIGSHGRGQTKSGIPFDTAGAWPFVSPSLSEKERAALYSKLRCVPMDETHLKHVNERVMIDNGDDTVVATEDIPAGTCLGAYGGYALEQDFMVEYPDVDPPDNDDPDVDETYILGKNKKYKGDIKSVDGNNILSRINTLFQWEGKDVVAQEKEGYNAEFVDMKGVTKEGKTELITFIFATEDIKAGQQLRVNYHYGKGALSRLFPRTIEAVLYEMTISD